MTLTLGWRTSTPIRTKATATGITLIKGRGMLMRRIEMKRNNNCMWLIAGALLAGLLVSQVAAYGQSGDSATQPVQNMIPASPSLPISFGDLIQVNVFDSPELSGSVR